MDVRGRLWDVVVIGGGISGLSAIHRLRELAPPLQARLLESSSRLGGVLETVQRDGFLIEGAADNFITNVPWATELCQRIGYGDELLRTNDADRSAFVVRRGRLEKIPPGFVIMAPSRIGPILRTPILSPLGKLRMALEAAVPRRRRDDDESLASFVKRRFGKEVYARLVQPLVGSIYTGDPERLSVRSTMPRFAEMERQHGSLIRAMLRQKRRTQPTDAGSGGARYSMFVAPRLGMSDFIEAIRDRLPDDTIALGTTVTRIQRQDDTYWSLQTNDGTLTARAIVVATPTRVAASLFDDLDTGLSAELRAIEYAGCVIVSLGYRRDQLEHALDGFGVVVPAIEKRKILSCSFSSVKYAGRAPDGHVLLRVFLGGDYQPELLALDDQQITALATQEVRDLLQIHGDPIVTHVAPRPASMPQYYLGHGDRVDRIERRLAALKSIFLAGSAYHGVGIPNCIHSGEQAAANAVQCLSVEAVA